MASGLQSAGVDVADLGMCPSPALAFEVARAQCPAAMVTASHNLPEWNGLQFLEPNSHIYGPDLEEAVKQELGGLPAPCSWHEIGEYSRDDGVFGRHIQAILTRVQVTGYKGGRGSG